MKRKLTCPTFSGVLLALAAAIPGQASTIHVPGDQPTIQAGIDAAATGDTVLVDPGTYFENINFNGKAITVQSASGAAVTIIDGGRAAPVAAFASGETPSSVLTGFTLQHGTSMFAEGGGVFITSSSPTISDNIITENTACGGGGGIAIEYASSPRIVGNTIQNNTQVGCLGGTGGGGILVLGTGNPQISGNVISRNSWPGVGGGISLDTSGIATIKNNVITGNSASLGGGISALNGSPALIVQNVIYRNSADQGAGLYLSIFVSAGPTLVNNTIANNNASQQGSAVYATGYDSQMQFFNNLMIGQPSQSAVYCDGSWSTQPPIVKNSDGFSPGGGTGFGGTCAGFETQNGNISANPRFINARNNFMLTAGSPAIDAGTNTAPLVPSTDISGQPRIVDGNGNGTAVIDMGAYEFQ
jgi:parallel beta-helix repeat protein